MQDEFETLTKTAAPTLTFDIPEEKEPPAEAKPEPPVQPEPMDDSVLSDEEKQMVEQFSEKIDIRNTTAILQYGAGTQKKMADFSEKALDKVKTKDLGEVGDLVTGLVTELKSFDVEEEEKGFLGFFKKTGNKLTAMKAKYEKAEVNVEKIVQVLEGHQIQLLKDVDMLDKMYELNLVYFK